MAGDEFSSADGNRDMFQAVVEDAEQIEITFGRAMYSVDKIIDIL